MFREMRRSNQVVPRGECLEILRRRENGVLALQGDDGYPYAVPLNHVCVGETLYFHCAAEGHKIDAIRRSDKASYCVIDADEVDAPAYSTRFRSAIVFGRVRLVEDEQEKIAALKALGDKFCLQTPEKTDREIQGALGHVAVLALEMEHISGKESRALARDREMRA